MDVKLIVSIDFKNIKSLEEAYRRWREIIVPTNLPYETHDEFYINGKLGNTKDLNDVCEKVVLDNPSLTFNDLRACMKNNQKIDWHDDYQHKFAERHPDKCILTEEWVDKPGPLTIIYLSTISEKKGPLAFVRYKCSDSNCRRCNDETLMLCGHHKVMRMNGNDIYKRIEFVETKKRTIINEEDQPVFKKA